MRIGSVSRSLLMLIAGGTASLILAAGSARAATCPQTDLVEFEKMTWVEVKCEIAAGKTTALIYTGGTLPRCETFPLHPRKLRKGQARRLPVSETRCRHLAFAVPLHPLTTRGLSSTLPVAAPVRRTGTKGPRN
jgi:hypothetical protein